MEMRWIHRWGALLVLFAGVNLAVTLYFQASVDAQRNAYASGVLVLISCACVVTYLEKRRHREILGGIGRWLAQWFFAGVADEMEHRPCRREPLSGIGSRHIRRGRRDSP